jgi:hypothetical protein
MRIYSCLGCKREVFGRRNCADCREYLYESMATAIDKSYDRAILHKWEDCWQILAKLYCWPIMYVNDGSYASPL